MDQLTHNWLHALCNLIPGVTRAVVFLKTAEKNQYGLAARWPEQLVEYDDLSTTAKDTVSGNKPLLLSNASTRKDTGEPRDIIGCPIHVDQHPFGAVVVELFNRVAIKQQLAVQQISAAAFWYEAILKQHSSAEKTQLVTIVELVASCLEHEKFQEAATDVVTDLTNRVSADRISIGFLDGDRVRIEAVSHSAGFDDKSNLFRDIVEALHEAIDQNSSINYPQAEDSVLPCQSHARLAEEHGVGAVLSVPFAANGRILGAVLFERPVDRPFDRGSIEYCQQIVSMIGPILDARRRDERGLMKRSRAAVRSFGRKLTDRGSTSFKAGVVGAVIALGLLCFAEKDYRITGDARLEAQTQRVIVSPQDGFIATANFRPGDIVKKGDLLGTLDNKDLTLEYQRWSSELGQLQTEYREALARHDRASVSILQARIAQTEAQMNLVREQLLRSQFTAPFDGLVVSGDLSQALGSPVERGQVLFTVAPLDVYRIILQIDERDIAEIKEGQPGRLILSSVSGKPLEFAVHKITPVSTAEEGRTFFQVEADIQEDSDLLRPGMEGVGKVTVERRKLAWIWTHRLIDWVRLNFWSFLP